MKFYFGALAVLAAATECHDDIELPDVKLTSYEDGNQGAGVGNKWKGSQNVWVGNDNDIDGDRNKLVGDSNKVTGSQNQVSGNTNQIKGTGNIVRGRGNVVHGEGNFVSSGPSNLKLDLSSRFPAWMGGTARSAASNSRNWSPSRASPFNRRSLENDIESRFPAWMRRVPASPRSNRRSFSWNRNSWNDDEQPSYRSNRPFMGYKPYYPSHTFDDDHQDDDDQHDFQYYNRGWRNNYGRGSSPRFSKRPVDIDFANDLRSRIRRQIQSQFEDYH